MSDKTIAAECYDVMLTSKSAPALGVATGVKNAKLMIVDDEPINVKIVKRLLELEGFSEFVTTYDSREAMDLIRLHRPDCILVDLMMPYVTGLDILDRMRSDPETARIPIIVLTAVADRDVRCDALRKGASDFLSKPIDSAELTPRVANVLAAKAYQDQLLRYSHDLEEAVRERTRRLEQANREIGLVLARAAEYRDNDTGLHVLRVGRYARIIAEELGVASDDADLLERAAQLHDVGKIGIPDDILLKPGKLTDDEFQMMKLHCDYGDRILQPSGGKELPFGGPLDSENDACVGMATPLLALAHRIAMSHHEQWDGGGYPLGLKGHEIPLEGRITAVADVFDSLSSKRCYKESMPLDECFVVMQQKRGSHFDPKVLDAFLRRQDEIINVVTRFADHG